MSGSGGAISAAAAAVVVVMMPKEGARISQVSRMRVGGRICVRYGGERVVR